MTLPPRLVDFLAVLAVTLAAAAMALGFPPKPLPVDSFQMVDYGLNTRQAVNVQAMLATLRPGDPVVYPEHYAYAPAFVVLLLLWLKLGALAFPLWIAASVAAVPATVWAAARATGLDRRRFGVAIACLGVLVASYAIGWDLKAHNVNLIYLALIAVALVLAARRPALAGLLLSLSVAIKLYSILFLPWLLWRRRWAWLGWTVLGLVLWFALLPSLWFGWPEAVAATKAWWQALKPAGEAGYQALFPGYLVSLHKTLANLMALPPTDAAVVVATHALQAAWLALVGWLIWRGGLEPQAEAALLVLAPLPLGPVLQPHHAAVFLLPAIVVAATAADPQRPRAMRGWCGAALVLCTVLMQSGPGGTWRGAAIQLSTLILALAIALAQREKRL